jgi:alpha-D-ribose 1-methylphosphonate 5-triphosphate synthase subunit PhnH
MKTNYPSLFGFVAAAALAFATMSPIARASDYDGSVWLTSAVQAPNGGTWIQLHTGIETGKTEARGGAPVYESVDEPGTIVSAPGQGL